MIHWFPLQTKYGFVPKDDELGQKDHRNWVSQLWCPEPSFPMHILGQGKVEKEEQDIVSRHTFIPESFEHCLEDWLCVWAALRKTFWIDQWSKAFKQSLWCFIWFSHLGFFEGRNARPLPGCLGIDGCPKFGSSGCTGKGYSPRTEIVWPSCLPSCCTNHCERTGLGILHKWCGKVVSWWHDWWFWWMIWSYEFYTYHCLIWWWWWCLKIIKPHRLSNFNQFVSMDPCRNWGQARVFGWAGPNGAPLDDELQVAYLDPDGEDEAIHMAQLEWVPCMRSSSCGGGVLDEN